LYGGRSETTEISEVAEATIRAPEALLL